jgi:hypothetical protein
MAVLPDMVLEMVSQEEYNPAPLYAVFDTGLQSRFLPQIPTPAGRWTGAGPPLSLSYLINLTFRC